MTSVNISRAEKSWLTRVRIAIDIGLVIADLNPILSEPLRLGVLFGTQAFFHNIWLAALSFGGITLLLDLLGTIGAVDLLDKNETAHVIEKARTMIEKRGLALSSSDTSLPMDIITALIIGTPFTLILKQSANPNRTRAMNIKRGLFLVIGTSMAAGLQGAAIVAGIWHPNAFTIGLALLAIVSILFAPRFLKRRFS